MVRDTHLAAASSGTVYIALSEQAPAIADHPVLSGCASNFTKSRAKNSERCPPSRPRNGSYGHERMLFRQPGRKRWNRSRPISIPLGSVKRCGIATLAGTLFHAKTPAKCPNPRPTKEAAQKRGGPRRRSAQRIFMQHAVCPLSGQWHSRVLSAMQSQAAPAGVTSAITSAMDSQVGHMRRSAF